MVEWRERGFVQDSDEDNDISDDNIESEGHNDVQVDSLTDIAEKSKQLDAYGHGLPEYENVASPVGHACNVEAFKALPSTPVTKQDLSTQILGQVSTQTSYDDFEDIDELQLDAESSNGVQMLRSAETGTTGNIPEASNYQALAGDLYAIPSSPLSPAPSDDNAANFDTGLEHVPVSGLAFGVVVESAGNPDQNSGVTISVQDLSTQHYTSTGRALRERNPIQLHPYLVESERYRQTFRSRGLRPIALANEREGEANEAQEGGTRHQSRTDADESQHTAYGDSSQYEPSPSRLLATRQVSDQSGEGSGEDDLPSLDSLLRTPTHDGDVRGEKRRKLTHVCSRGSRDVRESNYAGQINTIAPTSPRNEDISGLFDLLPSPRQFGERPLSVVKTRRRKRFRVPKGFNQNPLPTPVASSDALKAQPATVQVSTDPEVLSDTDVEYDIESAPRRSQLPNGDSSNSVYRVQSPALEPSDSSPSEAEQIQKASKRMKGVLPASWLRLDQQGRKRRPAALQHLALPRVTNGDVGPQRGIAQRITSRANPERHNLDHYFPETIEIQDHSDSTESNQAESRQTRRLNRMSEEATPAWNLDTQDIDEEDFIDPMLPAVPRNRISKPRRKRQLRLPDAYNRAKEVFDPYRHQQTSIPRNTRTMQKSTASKRRPASRFSIVDAVRLMPRQSTPDFLSLAVRQAKLRPDKGRHSPSGKVISLHIREDNIEKQRDLQRWKKGRMTSWTKYVDPSYRAAPRLVRRVTQRAALPLGERASNRQDKLPSPERPPRISQPVSGTGVSPPCSSDLNITKFKKFQTRLNPTAKPRTVEGLPRSNQRRIVERDETDTAPPQPKSPKVSWTRPGHLENLQMTDDAQHRDSAFRRELRNLDEPMEYLRSHNQRVANPLLERYVGNGSNDGTTTFREDDSELSNSAVEKVLPAPKLTRRIRKRRPNPLPVNGEIYERLTTQDFFPSETETPVVDDQPRSDHCQLSGLGPFGTKYSSDFGVKILPLGTFFHRSTLIGSGDLHHALEMHKRNFDIATNHTQFYAYGQSSRLGPWIEETSSQLEKAFRDVAETIKLSCDETEDESEHASRVSEAISSVSVALRSVIRYYSNSLSFLDSIDRFSFVSRTCETITALLDTVGTTKNSSTSTKHTRLFLRTLSLVAVCCFQNMKIANHPVVETEKKQATEQIFRRTSITLANLLIQSCLPRIEDVLRQFQLQSVQEKGIHEDQAEIEALVVLSQLLRSADIPGLSLWEVLNDALLRERLSTSGAVHDFEFAWSWVFSVLPILNFDTFGTAKPGLRFELFNENWSLIKIMLQRLFDTYSKSSHGHAATINSYLRAILARCFTLVNYWNWRKCEPALGLVFDFFAKRNFALLSNEDNRGYPIFLEQLDHAQSHAIEPSDRSFDIFLKFLAIGLQSMSSVYTPKKIKNVAWRFIPNHGRSHIKENDLHVDDLDALRNHHNLLTVLYWASPTLHRINIDLIRNLVDFQSSHSEICRLNARTWANLVRYQLSTDEDVSAVDPFSDWFSSMLTKSIRQHEKARPEAESIMETMKTEGKTMSKEMLESTISGNEKEIESILTLVLASMSSLLANAKVIDAALRLFEKSTIADVLQAFKPKHRRFAAIIIIALDVYQSYFSLLIARRSKRVEQETSEDSQDYGEWALLDDIDEGSDSRPNNHSEEDAATESVQHLLSNAFGAENLVDEKMLVKVVDTWVRICHFRIQRSKGDWSYYLDNQSPGSWTQLRDTEQTRKFAPYFLSSIVDCDKSVFTDNVASILSTWLVSLVERESMLKYQHLLTNALLNAGPDHALLQNLPFARANETRTWNISLADLRSRRLSLLSSILSNMRESFKSSLLSSQAISPRQELASVLKQLMQAMKKNYLETQPSSSVRGAYVGFAHRVVEFLQQYTADICPIDKFFTDSSAFPLPATDPTYVVGRLKNYSLQLASSSVQKKLATFFQVACERAVVDNEQTYLIGQIVNSVAGSFESLKNPQPSLRRFLLDALFPSYIESALSTDCGWILVMPILEATTAIFDELLYYFSASEKATCEMLVQAISSMFHSLRKAVAPAVTRPASFTQSHVLMIATAIFNCLTRALTAVDYIHRTWQIASVALRQVAFFHALGISLSTSLGEAKSPDDIVASISTHVAPLLTLTDDTRPASSFDDIAAFCRRELHETLTKSWVKHAGCYYILRGNSRKDVMAHTTSFEEGRSCLLVAIDAFKETVERLPAFRTLLAAGNRGLKGSRTSRRVGIGR